MFKFYSNVLLKYLWFLLYDGKVGIIKCIDD